MNSSHSSSLLPQSIAIIDGAVSNSDVLLQGLTVDHVVTINTQQDGVAQITQVLNQYENLDSVHIFSHGTDATLQLGNSSLSASTLSTYSEALAQWGDAMSLSGDVLLYGCNVAATADGLAFVHDLSQATGTDVAASTDLTGYGGDWDLEVSTGRIESTPGVAVNELQPYTGTLNLLINGSFEDNTLESGGFGDFIEIPGWTLSTPGGRIELQKTGSVDGETRVELDSFQNSGMVQTVDTVAGDRYQLSFQYTPRPQNALESNGIEVYWNGELLDTIAEDGSNLEFGDLQWQPYAYEVTATDASSELEFLAVGTSDGIGGLLDAVELVEVQPPPDTSIQFTEVTATAGVTYTGESHGAAWGDVNGDGFVDLWTTNHNSLPTLYLNQGDGTFDVDTSFSPVTDTDTHGSAFADFDNDGDQDLVVVTGANFGLGADANQLYVNENGSLSDRAADLGVDYGLARARTPQWFDYDNDGRLDLIISSLFRGDGEGLPTIFRQTDTGFEEVKDETGFGILGSRYSLISDLDQDGQMELLVDGLDANFNDGLTIYETGSTPFTNVTSTLLPDNVKATDMVIADFNGDLRPDIFATRDGRNSGVAQVDPSSAELFLQSVSTEQGIQFSATEDVLFDFFFTFELSLTDIFIGSSGINPSSRRFTLSANDTDNQGIVPHTAGVDPGLYIGYDPASGEWQVLLSANNNYRRLVGSVSTTGTLSDLSSVGFDVDEAPLTERLLINTPQGFVDQSQSAGITLNPVGGESVAAGDFDNDKDIDVYIVSRDLVGNSANILYENQGDGTFIEVAQAGGAAGTDLGVGESVAVADYDGDGFLDLFVLNGKEPKPFDGDGRNQLFRNAGNDNNWIELDLEGVISNRDGIGAQVYVTSGGTTQLREQNGGIHKHSQHHTRLHFGLAQDSIIDQIRIVWPSGAEQVLTNVDVNQLLTITETDGSGPDVIAPTVTGTVAPTVTDAGATTYAIEVTYADNEAIATATLDNADIDVTGPNGFSQTATFVSVDPATNGSPRTATYQITPPGGTWDEADNGTYTIALNGGEVSDVNGNSATATTLGDFTVNIVGNPPPIDGLLQNPGFEAGLSNWDVFSPGASISTTEVFAGQQSLELTADGGGVSQILQVVAGETYRLETTAKTDASGWSGFGLNFYDQNWNAIDLNSRQITATDWTSYVIQDVAPADAAFAIVWTFKGGPNGTTYFDDFSFDINDDVVEPGVVFFDDFETNQGWVVDPNNSDTATTGQWEVVNPQQTSTFDGIVPQLGTTVSGTQALVTGGFAGNSVGSFDVDNGITSVRSPQINLQNNATFNLSFSYYLAHLNNSDPNDILRVTVVGEQTSRVVLFEQGGSFDRAAEWTAFSTDISDFSGQTVTLLVEAQDGGIPSLVEAAIDDLAISIASLNQAPVITSGGGQSSLSLSIDENTSAVTTVTATDPEGDTAGNGLSYSLQGSDASQLTIDANTGELQFITAPDFENPTDSNGDNQYEVDVVVTDSGGATDVQQITVTVQDLDDVTPGVIFFDDFETNQGWFVNPNNSDTATTGQWQVTNPQQTSTFDGVVQQLGTTVSGTQALVTGGFAGNSVGSFDVDNGITSVRSPQINLQNNATFNLSFSYYLAHLNNSDPNDILRVTVVGEQTSRVVLFEQGGSFDRAAEWTAFSTDISDFSGQTVTLLVEAQDGGIPSLVEAAIDDLAISIASLNQAPVITSGGGQSSLSLSIDENTSAVTTVTATDPEGDTAGNGLSYSLQGSDASQLTIDANTGELQFITAPDFENPTDSNGDNQYEVDVVVTDSGGATDVQQITVTVQDLDDVTPGVIFFDDFETNQGWFVNPNNSDTATTGQWQVTNPQQTSTFDGVVQQLGTTVSGTQALVTGGFAGNSVGSFDVDNGITSVRSPQIALQNNATFNLSFSYYLAHLNNSDPNDFFSVTVVGEQSSRVVLFQSGEGSDRAAEWTPFSVDISEFAGENIFLLVEAQDGGLPSLVEAALDDLAISIA